MGINRKVGCFQKLPFFRKFVIIQNEMNKTKIIIDLNAYKMIISTKAITTEIVEISNRKTKFLENIRYNIKRVN